MLSATQGHQRTTTLSKANAHVYFKTLLKVKFTQSIHYTNIFKTKHYMSTPNHTQNSEELVPSILRLFKKRKAYILYTYNTTGFGRVGITDHSI